MGAIMPPDGRLSFGGTEYMTGTGQVLYQIHSREKCAGRPCVIHNPSDHMMRAFPTHWREDRGIMERICPHGVGHPDPDDLAFWAAIAEADPNNGYAAGNALGIHGCDGCCHE